MPEWNWKRLILCVIAVFGFLFLFDMIYYGLLMPRAIQIDPDLWRPQTEKQPLLWMLGQSIFAFGFSALFARFGLGGIRGGMEFGIGIGVLMAVNVLYNYVALPLTLGVLCFQATGALIEYSVAGLIAGSLYKGKN